MHRGRALAAFNHLLALRVQKLNTEKRGSSGTSVPGQTNVQSDLHALLAPISQNEESLLSTVWITCGLFCLCKKVIAFLSGHFFILCLVNAYILKFTLPLSLQVVSSLSSRQFLKFDNVIE